ncbi:MAG: stalk domain-containing protein [Candidatus Ornithomonoglobus sp.]
MKKALKGYVAGFATAAILAGGISYAANSVKIVIDNKELIPTDADGNRVEAQIINGTTYLPVRAVANAFGKAVYWDGETSTVYLGDMSGALPYPSVKLADMVNIGQGWYKSDELTDNYGNRYSNALRGGGNYTGQYILNGKYSKLKGTIYVAEGEKSDKNAGVVITADGKDIYVSSEITKTTYPIEVDLSIKGCNILEITKNGNTSYPISVNFGNAGLYQ